MDLLGQLVRVAVLEKPEVGSERFPARIFREIFKKPSLRRRPENRMVGKMHPAEKVHAGGKGFDEYFFGMEFKPQFVPQKTDNVPRPLLEPGFVFRKNDEIVGVADVMFRFERVLRELVELIHVHVHQKLTREVPERQALPLSP